MRSATVVALLSAGLCGCVPYPHSVTLSPAIDGSLAREMNPLALQVSAHLGWTTPPCQGQSVSARPTPTGQFQLARQTDFRLTYAPFVAPIAVTPWELCVSDGISSRVAYRSIAAQMSDAAVTLACDATKSEPTMDQSTTGFCVADVAAHR
jgi:hypothetical protein